MKDKENTDDCRGRCPTTDLNINNDDDDNNNATSKHKDTFDAMTPGVTTVQWRPTVDLLLLST